MENGAPTSRLCIKNIPKYANDARLREHFSQKGEVTDVRIVKTRDGMSRQMGFIGYKTVEEAVGAVKYFNRSFMDTCRLEVEFARKYGDTDISRPWSKHSEGSTAHARGKVVPADSVSKVVDGHAAELMKKGKLAPGWDDAPSKKKDAAKAGGEKVEDPRLAEFLSLMAPRSKSKVWANDDTGRMEDTKASTDNFKPLLDDDDDDDDEEYMDFMQPAGGKAASRSDDEADGSDDGGDEEAPNESGTKADKEVVENAALSDLDYLRARVTSWDDDDDDVVPEGALAAKRGDQSGVGPSLQSATAAPGVKKSVKFSLQSDGGGEGDGDEDSEGGDKEEGASKDAEMEDVRSGQDGGKEKIGRRFKDGVEITDFGGGQSGGSEASVEELIADTGRLFLRNLPYSATETDLTELFGGYGQLQEVHLVLDRETKKSKGIAYILFQMPEDAVTAHREQDGQIFQGRLLHILPAKRPPTLMADRTGLAEDDPMADDGDDDKKGGSFKGERAAQRKEDAGDRSVWNTLFMRADTVAEAVAAHYGVSKAELLDRGASDLPVRMALGEAHVVSQTKMALAEAGVDISKIEAAAAASGKASQTMKVARSATTLLVKNLPYSTSEEDLLEMFSRSGPLSRLVLPPTRTMALVEFLEPGDARSAFKALAYKKFQHVPLYLEWAPKDVFSTPPPDAASREALMLKAKAHPAAEKAVARAAVAAVATAIASAQVADQTQQTCTAAGAAAAAEAEDEDGASTTIFVKNLAFATTDAQLKKHFDKAVSSVGGCLHSARVAMKKGPDGKILSTGYGFLECDSEAVAKATIKKLQGSGLEGHNLVLQLSSRKDGDAAKASAKKGSKKDAKASAKADAADVSTKLVVRNVAFEATRKDLSGLFSPFGSIKSCRLPKKFDGSHRGFAFVEYVTKQEAKNAMEGVGGTHLYGRRLVVEYAEEGEGLDELRAKTASKFLRGSNAEQAVHDNDAPSAKRARSDE